MEVKQETAVVTYVGNVASELLGVSGKLFPRSAGGRGILRSPVSACELRKRSRMSILISSRN